MIKVNVGGMEFIYISSYRAVFSLFLIRKKILKLIIHQRYRGKLWLQWLLIQKMTPYVFSANESLYDNLTKFLDYRVFGGFFSFFGTTVYYFHGNFYANSGLFFFCDRNNCLFIFVFTVAILFTNLKPVLK